MIPIAVDEIARLQYVMSTIPNTTTVLFNQRPWELVFGNVTVMREKTPNLLHEKVCMEKSE